MRKNQYIFALLIFVLVIFLFHKYKENLIVNAVWTTPTAVQSVSGSWASATNTIDGNTSTGNTYLYETPNAVAIYDMGSTKSIFQAKIYLENNGYAPPVINVYVSDDVDSFGTAVATNWNPVTGSWQTSPIFSKSGRYVKYEFSGGGGYYVTYTTSPSTYTYNVNMDPQINEVEILVTPATGPTVTSASLASDNSYLALTFSENIFTDSGAQNTVEASDFALTFTQKSDQVTNVSISDLYTTSSLSTTLASGTGYSTIYVGLSVTNGPSVGFASVEIKPASGTAIYNGSGEAMSTDNTSGVLKLISTWFSPISVQSAVHMENPYKLIDGDTSTIWNNWGSNYAFTPPTDWVIFDLGTSKTIEKVRYNTTAGDWICALYVSDDPDSMGSAVISNWIVNGAGWHESTAISSTGRYVKIDCESGTSDDYKEFQVYTSLGPTISSASVDSYNDSYIDITFSENVYSDDSQTVLSKDDFSLTFTGNGDDVTGAVIEGLYKKNENGLVLYNYTSLQQGTDYSNISVKLNLEGGPSNGSATVEIKPASSSAIYSLSGEAMLSTETTGAISLDSSANWEYLSGGTSEVDGSNRRVIFDLGAIKTITQLKHVDVSSHLDGSDDVCGIYIGNNNVFGEMGLATVRKADYSSNSSWTSWASPTFSAVGRYLQLDCSNVVYGASTYIQASVLSGGSGKFDTTLSASATLTEPDTISSLADTGAEEVDVFDFVVADGGSDSLNTVVEKIIITRGSNDTTSDWTNYIGGATLSDGVSDLVWWESPPEVESTDGLWANNYIVNETIDDDFSTSTQDGSWIIYDLSWERVVTKASIYSGSGSATCDIYVSNNNTHGSMGTAVLSSVEITGAGWQETDTFSATGRYLEISCSSAVSSDTFYEVLFQTSTGLVSSGSITFGDANSTLDTITNSTNQEYTLSIWLQASLPDGASGKIIEFDIDPNDDVVVAGGSSMFPLTASSLTSGSKPAISIDASNIVITSDAFSSYVNTSSSAITIEARDDGGQIASSATNELYLFSTSAGGEFSATSNFSSTIESISLVAGQITVYYRDSTNGNPTITISDATPADGSSGLNDATQEQTIYSPNNDATLTSSSSLSEPDIVSTEIDTEAEAVDIFDFTIADGGGGDSFNTIIKQISITRGSSDTTSDWTNYISGAKLTDGLTTESGTINSNSIVFGDGNSTIFSVADNNNKTFTLSIWLNSGLTSSANNKVIDFDIDANDDVVVDGSGSGFSAVSSVTSSTTILYGSINITITSIDISNSTYDDGNRYWNSGSGDNQTNTWDFSDSSNYTSSNSAQLEVDNSNNNLARLKPTYTYSTNSPYVELTISWQPNNLSSLDSFAVTLGLSDGGATHGYGIIKNNSLQWWGASGWQDSGEFKRTITLNSATSVVDSQIRIELTTENFDYTNVRSDGGDIRFYDASDNQLNYWMESWSYNGTSVVWVKIPTVSTSTIYMHYGNSGLESESDLDSVFDAFSENTAFSNWLHIKLGGAANMVAGWEDALTEFSYDTSAWSSASISNTGAYTLANMDRLLFRKDFFIKSGSISFSGQATDNDVWTLIKSDNTYQKIRGNELATDTTAGDYTWSESEFTVANEGRYVWSGRSQGRQQLNAIYEYLKLNISSVDSGTDKIFTRKNITLPSITISSERYVTNTAGDINDNINLLSVSTTDSINIRTYLSSNGSQSAEVDNIAMGYNSGSTYTVDYNSSADFTASNSSIEVDASNNNLVRLTPTANYSTAIPYVDPASGSEWQPGNIDYLNSFTANLGTNDGGGSHRYILIVDGQYKYFTTKWVNSDGTYSQSNLASTIDSNISTLSVNENSTISFRAYLSSGGSQPAELNSVVVGGVLNQGVSMTVSITAEWTTGSLGSGTVEVGYSGNSTGYGSSGVFSGGVATISISETPTSGNTITRDNITVGSLSGGLENYTLVFDGDVVYPDVGWSSSVPAISSISVYTDSAQSVQINEGISQPDINPYFAWSAPESVLPITGYRWKISRSTCSFTSEPFNTTVTYVDYATYGNLPEGSSYFCVQAQDSANYIGGAAQFNIITPLSSGLISAEPLTIPVMTKPEAISDTEIKWNFIDNNVSEEGFRLFDSHGLIVDKNELNITYITEDGLNPNTKYDDRYIVTYNSYSQTTPSNTAESIYTLTPVPTNFNAVSTIGTVTLTVGALNNDESGKSGYYFTNIDNNNSSGWISEPNWIDIDLVGGATYNYEIKYRNGDAIESASATLSITTQEGMSPFDDDWDGFISINNGANYVNSSEVALSLSAINAIQFKISNTEEGLSDVEWISCFDTESQEELSVSSNEDCRIDNYNWQLDGLDGVATVYAIFRDVELTESAIIQDSIILDTIAPKISIIYPVDGQILYTNSVNILGTAENNMSGELGLYKDSEELSVYNFSSNEEGEWNYSVEDLAIGEYAIFATVVDSAGNIGKSEEAKFTIEQKKLPAFISDSIEEPSNEDAELIGDAREEDLGEDDTPIEESKDTKTEEQIEESPTDVSTEAETESAEELDSAISIAKALTNPIKTVTNIVENVTKNVIDLFSDDTAEQESNIAISRISEVAVDTWQNTQQLVVKSVNNFNNAHDTLVNSAYDFVLIVNGIASNTLGRLADLFTGISKIQVDLQDKQHFVEAEPSNAPSELPNDKIIYRSEFGNIDIVQRREDINFSAGGTFRAFIKPSKKVEKITAHIIYVGMQTNSMKKNSGISLIPVVYAQEKKIELEEFEFTDLDLDGIYDANIKLPESVGDYIIKTIITYADGEIVELDTMTEINSNGYVFNKTDVGSARIEFAEVTLYYLNPTTKKFEIWQAGKYGQNNPQTTGKTGQYSFTVPAGHYYLGAIIDGYYEYKSEAFYVKEGRNINTNVEMIYKNVLFQKLFY